LKVGDNLPVCNSLAINTLGHVTSINVREHLPPTEWLYGTDVQAALKELRGKDRHWFQKNNGTLFTIPYSRSDSFREGFVDGKNTNAASVKPGFVYPARTRPDVSQIPDEIPLTREFGFFVGAYLAEGMSNTTQVNITNNDTPYLDRVDALMAEWNVGTHRVSEDRHCQKTDIKGHTTSTVIHSTILATLMQRLFGRVSHEKTMPDWVFQAPDEFVKGLVDAYISGDGSVSKQTGYINAASISYDLLNRFRTLLARYAIFSRITSNMPELGVFDSVRMNYTLSIPKVFSKVFADNFSLSISYKQEILDYHFQLTYKERDGKYPRAKFNEVVLDPIVSIKEVVPIKEKVYDLTVAGTRNFMTLECMGQADTFHLAGVAAKSNVTRGVPRLKELLKVTQNPKAISLTVTLRPEIRDSREKARKVAQDLELTLLKDITVKAAIYYDPDDSESVLEEDRALVAFYKAFEAETEPAQAPEERFGEEGAVQPESQVWSRLMLRLELDRQRMFRKNISMDDIAFVLRQKFGEAINLVYSDYNTQRLIMRIRIPPVAADDTGMDDMIALKKLQNRLLTGIVIRGVAGIKAVTFRQDKDVLEYNKEEGIYKPVTQYVLDTDGTNFLAVMNHPYVDGTKLVSSHVHDIYENLGIEATRSTLIQEITTLFEETGVNCRHVGLLCDVMTRQGRLMSVDRYGINKMDIGPIAKASFEETEKILLRAALFGEVDPVTGISANIMMGQPIRGGTGFFHILFDEGAFMRLQEGLPPANCGEEEGDGPTKEQIAAELTEDQGDICSTARLRMNVAMPQKAVLMEEPDIEIMILGSEESS
jgi:DNA-directed RNA polymerase beta' subunit